MVKAGGVPNNTWQRFVVAAQAPAATVRVRARASMVDGVLQPNNPQSAFVDDFDLIPEPTSFAAAILGVLAISTRRHRRG